MTYTCTVEGCGETKTEVIEASGHDYKAVVTDPTCTKEGYTTYTCHCGVSYVDNIVPAHGHNVVLQESEAPTCELNGFEYYACEHCGGQEYTIILEATGHNYEDGKCTNCGADDPNANKPGTGSGNWIGNLFGKWFDKWFGGSDEPTVPPTEPEVPSEPSKPEKPGWSGIFDWIFWWKN